MNGKSSVQIAPTRWRGVTHEGSFLIADCGSTQTTVALIERVNGHYRLVARGEALSSHHPPWLDAMIGVREAIRQIEALVGRRLLTQTGELIKPQISELLSVQFV